MASRTMFLLDIVLVIMSVLTAFEAKEVQRKEVNGIVHGNVFLTPNTHVPEDCRKIEWSFNDTLRILTTENNGTVEYHNQSLKKRFIYHKNNTLEIIMLQESDASTYRVDIKLTSGAVERENIQLDVYDHVSKPKLTLLDKKEEGGWCNVTLHCVASGKGVIYQWWKDDDPLYEMGSNLMVTLHSEKKALYKCNASNPVSSETSTMHYEKPCTFEGNTQTAFL
uniref:Ig-like domain-containing protein n=1 Tax=Sphenodon punctatus TaxID=8508 RepID=A0A8D0L1J4_SPHPU